MIIKKGTQKHSLKFHVWCTNFCARGIREKDWERIWVELIGLNIKLVDITDDLREL
jgi:hypothetical protein